MIRIEALSHVYPPQRRRRRRSRAGDPPSPTAGDPGGASDRGRLALDALTLAIEPGAFSILAGPNGSGKSTLFRILCGLARPSAGRVLIGGHDLATHPGAVRALCGVVFQAPALDKHLTVAENMTLHGHLYGLAGAELTRRRDEALAWTGLSARLGDRVGTLSGGLARQVELAKSLMTHPRVLLLDEPTTGLDPAARRAFLDVLLTIQKERGLTVLMTSHVFSEAEEADRVAILRQGVLLANDSPAALRRRLGRDMLVVTARDAADLAPRLSRALGLDAVRHGDEIRIESLPPGGPVPLIDAVLTGFRDQVISVAVKQPTLDDVFIHITEGGSLAEAAAPGPVGVAPAEALS